MGSDEEAFGRRLQESSRHARPLGSDESAQHLENQIQPNPAPLPAGRPRKRTHEDNGELSLEGSLSVLSRVPPSRTQKASMAAIPDRALSWRTGTGHTDAALRPD